MPTFRELTPFPDDGDVVPEMSENLHILTRLSARENIIELCRHESFKTYNIKCYVLSATK